MSTTIRQITAWLLRPQTEPRTTWGTILWWEKRRPFYNLFVGLLGISSFIAFLFIMSQPGMVKPGEDAVEPLAMLLSPIPINFCYTLGWIVEVITLGTGKGSQEYSGPALMKFGIAISLFAIFFPLTMATMAWTAHLAFRH